MAVKSVSIRIEQEMLDKIGYIADYQGRSVNSHILVLIRNEIEDFEKEHGVCLSGMKLKILKRSMVRSQGILTLLKMSSLQGRIDYSLSAA